MLKVIGSISCALLFAAGAPSVAAGADLVTPSGDAETAWILSGGNTKEYFEVRDKNPLEIPLEGPGTLTVYFRAHYPKKTKDVTAIHARIENVKVSNPEVRVEVKRSSSSEYDDDRAGYVSAGGKVQWSIPKGTRTARITATSSTGQPVFAILYFAPAAQAASGMRRVGPFTMKGRAYVGFVYDDNPIHYSDGDLMEFRLGENPGKFDIVTRDDLILNPR